MGAKGCRAASVEAAFPPPLKLRRASRSAFHRSGKLGLVPFEPSKYTPRFTGGHLQTLYAWAKPRRFAQLPPPVERYFDVAADARVLAHCHWHERRDTHPTLLLLHGLEGSSRAHYICGISDKAWSAG